MGFWCLSIDATRPRFEVVIMNLVQKVVSSFILAAAALSLPSSGYALIDSSEPQCGDDKKSVAEPQCGDDKKSVADPQCGDDKKSVADPQCGDDKKTKS